MLSDDEWWLFGSIARLTAGRRQGAEMRDLGQPRVTRSAERRQPKKPTLAVG